MPLSLVISGSSKSHGSLKKHVEVQKLAERGTRWTTPGEYGISHLWSQQVSFLSTGGQRAWEQVCSRTCTMQETCDICDGSYCFNLVTEREPLTYFVLDSVLSSYHQGLDLYPFRKWQHRRWTGKEFRNGSFVQLNEIENITASDCSWSNVCAGAKAKILVF